MVVSQEPYERQKVADGARSLHGQNKIKQTRRFMKDSDEETLLTDLAKSGSSNPSSPWQKAFAAKKPARYVDAKIRNFCRQTPLTG